MFCEVCGGVEGSLSGETGSAGCQEEHGSTFEKPPTTHPSLADNDSCDHERALPSTLHRVTLRYAGSSLTDHKLLMLAMTLTSRTFMVL